MATYIEAGEMAEGEKARVVARRMEFKKGGLRKDPITHKNMVLYELDRNCSFEVTESMKLTASEQQIRDLLSVHGDEGDILVGEAMRLYYDSKRDSLRAVVKEGQSSRHGASIAETNRRTIGKIKTPFSIYDRLLGYSARGDLQKEVGQKS